MSQPTPTFVVDDAIAHLPRETREFKSGIPIKVLGFEARQVYDQAMIHKARFEALPEFDFSYVARIPVLVEALERCERDWIRERSARYDEKTAELRAEGERLRSYGMAAARFLLRKDPVAVRQLAVIAEGEGLPDLVDDLKQVGSLIDANADKFSKDPRLPPNPGARMREVAQKLEARVDDTASREALGKRNQVAFMLDEALVEVRAAARYLFRDEHPILKNFISGYETRRKRNARRADDSEQPET